MTEPTSTTPPPPAHPPGPPLAPPGAGIPALERWIGGVLLSLRRRWSSRDAITRRFHREHDAIEQLWKSVDDAAGSTRVLIPRLPGLEDSSRYWSVWMTIDHLRIVNAEIARVLASLGRGETPAGQASTAAVKPAPDAGPGVLPGYEDACRRFLAAAAATPELRTTVRFPHPWFGPLDAAGWHALAAAHMGIHRRQIARIVRGLPSVTAPPPAPGRGPR